MIATEKTVRKRVASLKPSPENEQLYKPIDPRDPEIVKLADSIKKLHLQQPLVLTLDNYVVSGHRRLVALKLNGQGMVLCRVLPVRRGAMGRDEYTALLREHNLQRHKSVAEQVREELVDVDPAQAHANLVRLRDKSAFAPEYNGANVIAIEGASVRHAVSAEKGEHVEHVRRVLMVDRRAYWPLSVRGTHYPLLNHPFLRNTRLELPYENNDNSYDATSDLLTRLRLNGTIPWAALDDFTRPFTEFKPFSDVRAFIRQEMKDLFGRYWRNLLQSQPNYVEVLVEKNTVYHMALRVTRKYQIHTASGRGINSIDPWHDLYERYRASGKDRLILIVMSDYDPEGEAIPHIAGRTLRDDFGVPERDLVIVKAGVTDRQIERYTLPPMNFAKESSSRYEWFKERNNGDDTVYELEAVDPDDMLEDLDREVRKVLDIDLLNHEIEIEKQEAAYLELLRRKVPDALRGIDDGPDAGGCLSF